MAQVSVRRTDANLGPGHDFGRAFSQTGISSRNISFSDLKYIEVQNTIDHATGSFGGWCQWVLDDACHAFEWLQPLGFDSLAL